MMDPTPRHPEPAEPSALTAEQQERATIFKWRYMAQAHYGFDVAVARRLTWHKWLYALGRLSD